MSTNLTVHSVEKWYDVRGQLGRLPRFSICQGMVIMLLIPTLLLMVYLALPVAMSYLRPEANRSPEPSHALQIDPACSPFGTLSTCVRVATPFDEPPA